MLLHYNYFQLSKQERVRRAKRSTAEEPRTGKDEVRWVHHNNITIVQQSLDQYCVLKKYPQIIRQLIFLDARDSRWHIIIAFMDEKSSLNGCRRTARRTKTRKKRTERKSTDIRWGMFWRKIFSFDLLSFVYTFWYIWSEYESFSSSTILGLRRRRCNNFNGKGSASSKE